MKTLIRTVLVLVIVVGVGALLLGYWAGSTRTGRGGTSTVFPDTAAEGRPADTTVERARERGAQVGEAVATAGERVRESAEEGSIAAKIKSKMALDDLVQARSVDVGVADDIVTLSGYVHSEAERNRALALARETRGVRSVVDHLQIRP